MKILPSLVISLLLTQNSAAETDINRVFKYFVAKAVHSVDALVCTTADGVKLFNHQKNVMTHSGHQILLRIVNSLDIKNVDVDRRTGLFIDVSCEPNRRLLLGLADDLLFTNTFTWLIWDPKLLLNEFYTDLPLATFSDVSVASGDRVMKLYRHRAGLPIIIQDVGMWDAEAQDYSIIPWRTRIDYQKTVVTGALMVIDDIYDRHLLLEQLEDDQYKPGNDVSNRFFYGNALHIAYLYNFTLNITESDNWGSRLDNGTWTGLIGLLQSQEADVALSPLIPLSARMDVSYPSIPVLPYWMAVIFKQPRALGTYKAMMLEFSPTAWACVAAMLIAGAYVFAVTQKHGPSTVNAGDNSESTFATGLFQSVGIITDQGICVVPDSISGRVVCITLLMVSVLLLNHYSAATMTALLSPSPPVIKSLEQLIYGSMPLAVVDAPYVHQPKVPTEVLVARVFRAFVIDRMEKDLTITNLLAGTLSILNGTAFMGEYFVLFRAITENLSSDVICELTIFNAGFHRTAVSFTKKNSHFREMYTRGMLRTMEHGLMPKERQKWIAGEPVCTQKTEFIHVQLQAVSVAFGIFCTGAGLSAAMLLAEIFLDRRERRTLKSGGPTN